MVFMCFAMVFITVFSGFHGYHMFLCIMHSQAMLITMEHTKALLVNLCINHVRAVQHFGSENMTKAWHDKGMEWHDEAWRGCYKLLQRQRTETCKIKKAIVQNRTHEINTSQPPSPSIQCWRQTRARSMTTLQFGGWGRTWGVCLHLQCALSCRTPLALPSLWNWRGLFFEFTGTPSWVLHGHTTHEEPQIYPRKTKANVHTRTCAH